jgi:hypothetical protein
MTFAQSWFAGASINLFREGKTMPTTMEPVTDTPTTPATGRPQLQVPFSPSSPTITYDLDLKKIWVTSIIHPGQLVDSYGHSIPHFFLPGSGGKDQAIWTVIWTLQPKEDSRLLGSFNPNPFGPTDSNQTGIVVDGPQGLQSEGSSSQVVLTLKNIATSPTFFRYNLDIVVTNSANVELTRDVRVDPSIAVVLDPIG